jgi:predicted dehydrogenase
MNKQSPILIIGAGSIGERHINNLIQLGYTNIHVFRQRNLPLRNVDSSCVQIHTDWEVVKNIEFVFAIICTPSSQHLAQTISCLDLNMHVLVEKPLSHNTNHLELLTEKVKLSGKLVYVAYMMRFHPHLIAVKNSITSNAYGKLLSIQTHWGSYLPDWHPYEDYTTSYAAQKALGGGVALTLSHDIDVVNWLSGDAIKTVHKHFSYAPHLGIDVESVADFQIVYENDVVANVHLNYLEKTPKRVYQFLFDKAKITIDYFAATMEIDNMGIITKNEISDFDRNNLFKDELAFFINTIQSGELTTLSMSQIAESHTIINLCNHE